VGAEYLVGVGLRIHPDVRPSNRGHRQWDGCRREKEEQSTTKGGRRAPPSVAKVDLGGEKPAVGADARAMTGPRGMPLGGGPPCLPCGSLHDLNRGALLTSRPGSDGNGRASIDDGYSSFAAKTRPPGLGLYNANVSGD